MVNKIYLFLVKNWKTSLAGLIVAILTFLFNMGYITSEQYTTGVGIVGSIGLFLSKDGDQTGNTARFINVDNTDPNPRFPPSRPK